jgi:hypothetical protein
MVSEHLVLVLSGRQRKLAIPRSPQKSQKKTHRLTLGLARKDAPSQGRAVPLDPVASACRGIGRRTGQWKEARLRHGRKGKPLWGQSARRCPPLWSVADARSNEAPSSSIDGRRPQPSLLVDLKRPCAGGVREGQRNGKGSHRRQSSGGRGLLCELGAADSRASRDRVGN